MVFWTNLRPGKKLPSAYWAVEHNWIRAWGRGSGIIPQNTVRCTHLKFGACNFVINKICAIVKPILDVPHPKLFHHMPGSSVFGISDCDDPIELQMFKAVFQTRRCSLSRDAQAPVRTSESVANFDFRSGVEEIQTAPARSEEHTSELQSPCNLVCRLLLEKKNKQ